MKLFCYASLLTAAISLPLQAGPFLDVETGPVFTGKNDAKINGEYGTPFSFTGVLRTNPWYFLRVRAGYTIKDRHTISLLAAPLKIESEGSSDRFLLFRQRLFLPGAHIKGTFKFNSFRITYRYDIVLNDSVEFGLGLTGKIRDAFIRLDSMGFKTTRPDLGFVPLINVRLQWKFVPKFSFLLDADWLVGPQGRAEDIMAAFQYHIDDHMTIRTGYRILEGGAKNSKVYTFSLFHYLVFGVTAAF
ncbi:MAG TPA: hypothetical protein PK307_06180 [Spirochaetota bacterium]|nr:hypothetical protein [Spirochaetota bacterium]HOD14647.1 hypothetical protein [Spirochaetota bacterium]HPN12575.1 hypothetical protein [Spirochaetota bacterium]HQL81767.1 hypothetical protein [Spirochaetota bacterium]